MLLFAVEDAPHIVRTRLQGICAAARVPAESSSGIELELGDRGGGLTLHVRDDAQTATAEQPRSPAERVLSHELRETCRLRNASLIDTLAALQTDGRERFEASHVQLALA